MIELTHEIKKLFILLLLILSITVIVTGCEKPSENGEISADIVSAERNRVYDDSGKIDNVIAEGKEYTLYLYDAPNYDSSDIHTTTKPIFPAVVLTINLKDESIQPTLVREGDTFLGWKAVQIDAGDIYYDDGRMYPRYYDGVIVQFEGEITVKAKIKYYRDDYSGESLYIVPEDEYQQFFPILYNADKEYTTDFCAYNTYEILNILEHKYGEYECEITVKDYHLIRVPIERVCMATVSDMSILSVIETYTYEE